MERKTRSKTDPKLRNIKQWTELVRDLGVIIGVPILILVGKGLYDRQIEVLKSQADSIKIQYEKQSDALKSENEAIKAQIKIYEINQYDKASSIIESQKKLFLQEREIYQNTQKSLEDNIKRLVLEGKQKNEETKILQARLETVNRELQEIHTQEKYLYAANSVVCNFRTDTKENLILICQGRESKYFNQIKYVISQDDWLNQISQVLKNFSTPEPR